MSWYRTYRPQTFASLHITPVREAFLNILSSGSFSHAYLLTGPKGTGKTSAARILAKVLNCEKNAEAIRQRLESQKEGTRDKRPDVAKAMMGKQEARKTSKKADPRPLISDLSLSEPCNTCPSCLAITSGSSLSVLEMDAASNRGIDDIRMLRERIGLAPPDGLISVFIIDEVHMLTTEAFNALLKVLEEPPAHVVFILATTDLQKMPATVVSRCIQIQYRKALPEELQTALLAIAKTENVSIADDLLLRIGLAGDGSFRDTVKLFETASMGKQTVTAEDIDAVLGKSTPQLVSALLNGLLKKSSSDVLTVFSTINETGMDGLAFQKTVLTTLHERMVEYAKTNDKRLTTVVNLLKAILVPIDTTAPIPWMSFEIACMEWTIQGKKEEQGTRDEEQTERQEGTGHRTQGAQQTEVRSQRQEVSDKKQEVQREQENPLEEKGKSKIEGQQLSVIELSQVQAKWVALLQSVKSKSVPVEGLLRVARPVRVDGNILICEASYQFHKEQLELDRNRLVVEAVLESLVGTPLKLRIELGRRAIAGAKLPDSNISGKVSDDALVKAAAEAFL